MKKELDKKTFKLSLLLIAYTLALILVVIHFETILGWLGTLLRLLTPLIIGIVIAFIFNRPYEMFRKLYLNKLNIKEGPAKILAIITIYTLTAGIGILIVGLVIPELVENLRTFAVNAPFYLSEAQTAINKLLISLDLTTIDFSALFEVADQYLSTLSDALTDLIPQIIEVTSNLISGVATTFIGIALSIYILSGKERLLSQIRRLLRAYLPKTLHAPVKSLFQTITQVFEDFVAGQCKEALILGSLCFAGMNILRLDYSGMISVVIALTALVPILGAYIGGAIGVLLLLFISPGKALLFLVFLIILQQFEGNVIYPRVVGRKIGLPGMWILVAISVGGGLMGVWGMLLAVPVTTIIYQLLQKDVRRKEAEARIRQKHS